jgi:N-acetylglucosaminyl-diphospho-decaprenol L-rhamnosyltransferase
VSRTAVLTVVSGRHDHLRGQLLGLRAGALAPDLHVVAAMGDPAVHDVVRDALRERPAGPATETVVIDVAVPADGELPLAAARNAAARRALAHGADLLVFLDVDCVPAPPTLARYREAVRTHRAPSDGPALWCGVVRYLPPLPPLRDPDDLAGLPGEAAPHPARPVPAADTVIRADDDQWWLFWSLSFAVTATDWRALGGFCERFRGYGGEDTDLAATARAAGGRLFWVGGAEVWHQHHETRNPPVQHLDAILRNAGVFHDRWGWHPMRGWLEEFRDRGLVRYDAKTSTWLRVSSNRR